MFNFFQGRPKTKLQQKREAKPDAKTKSTRQIKTEAAKNLNFDARAYEAKAVVINSKHLTKTQKDQILNSEMTPDEMKAAVKKAKEDKSND